MASGAPPFPYSLRRRVIRRLIIVKLALVAFALATLPALVWRWQQIVTIPAPLSWVVRPLFALGLLWDIFIIREALLLRETDLRWRLSLQLAPRLFLTILLALLVDGPAYSRPILYAKMATAVAQDVGRWGPAGYRQTESRRELERLHFLYDPPFIVVPREDPQRTAFLASYVDPNVLDDVRMTRIRLNHGCPTFTARARAVSLNTYPTLVARTDRIAGFCADLDGDPRTAAEDYIAYERSYDRTSASAARFALMDAEHDRDTTAVIHYLQQQMLATPASRLSAHDMCVTHYTQLARRLPYAARAFQFKREWILGWERLYGNTCRAIGTHPARVAL